jgi:hypothetical protein
LPMFRFHPFQDRVREKKKTCLDYRMRVPMSTARITFFPA